MQQLLKDFVNNRDVWQMGEEYKGFKTVILNDVQLMSREAQAALRRTMEK